MHGSIKWILTLSLIGLAFISPVLYGDAWWLNKGDVEANYTPEQHRGHKLKVLQKYAEEIDCVVITKQEYKKLKGE
jgi:hypothetical protein